MTIISIEVHYIKMAQVLYQLFYVGANVRKLIVLGTSYLYVLGTQNFQEALNILGRWVEILKKIQYFLKI